MQCACHVDDLPLDMQLAGAQIQIPQKVVVFTESKRTQKYIAAELRNDGYAEEDILLFNGDFKRGYFLFFYQNRAHILRYVLFMGHIKL